MFYPYINQALFTQNQIIDIKKVYNIAKCTVKIEISINNKISIGSGFFLKFERNNKMFYCLMTNQHVITSDLIKEKKEILIKYENENHSLSLKLDEEERIIICFKEVLNLDVTTIEIIPKDKVKDKYFLTPNINPQFGNVINIQVVQFPLGNTLSFSRGQIYTSDCIINIIFTIMQAHNLDHLAVLLFWKMMIKFLQFIKAPLKIKDTMLEFLLELLLK